jgi:iron complex transport system permease protein
MLIMLIGTVLLLVFAVLSLRFGAVQTPFEQIIDDFRAGKGLVFDYRLPRLLIAILVGINMAVAGSIMQGVTRNPLASPDLVGITAGAGLVSVIMLLVVADFHPLMLQATAFVGAVSAGFLVYALAYKRSAGIRPERLVLSGVAVSSGLHALITFILVKYAPNASQALVFLKGSLYARSWKHVEMLWPWTLVGVALAILLAVKLNVLLLGEDTVKGLGMRSSQVRLLLLAVTVGLAGSAVAVAGTIGFIGLVVPHFARLFVGTDFRRVIPVSALLGALLLVIADMAGRVIMPPLEIPAGIITALIGAPYFVYLLVRRQRVFG